MGFLEAVKHVYSNYVNFRDRAPRSEYWWFVLFNVIVSVIIGIVEAMLGLGSGMAQMGGGSMSASFAGGPLSIIWMLVNLLPGIGVGVRRLHDTDRSGWWLLIGLVPLVGAIVLLVFFCQKGTTGANRFGPDPLP
jgi:uncharacterized membrane protein YhaH (DUF805 family)